MADTMIGRPAVQSSKRGEMQRVSHLLDQLCSQLIPGDKVPTHTELMRRFGASERMVLRALEEMRQSARIVRRAGSGTFVTGHGKPGSSLTASYNRTVVALARPDHSFFDRCMEQLSQYTDEAHWDLVCRPLRPEREAALTWESLGSPYGCFLFGYDLAPLARQFQDRGARVVLVGTPSYGSIPPVSCIYGAQKRGGYLATKHLLDLGHRRLAYLNDGVNQSLSRRWHGIQKALQEMEHTAAPAILVQLTTMEMETWRDNPSRAAAWAHHPEAPTGVIAWNDDVALRLLSALARVGVQVPEEISVVGYDALPEGERAHPALTTVEPFLSELLEMAVEILAQQEQQLPAQTGTVAPTLVIRESTAPPPHSVSTA